MVDLARLAELKRLLNDGTLTREEFEALKQKDLQADGTDRGSDCASPAPAAAAPVYGAATGNAVPGAHGASTPTLAEMGEVFRKDLGVGGTNLVELVEASCVVLGVSVKGKSLAQQANECWRILNGAKLPAGQVSAGGCGDSTGGMKTTDPFAVPATHGGPHERIAERLSRVRASAALSASRRSSTRVAPAITKSASSVSSGLAVDTETSAGSAADDCKYINRSKDSYASQLGFPSTGKLPSDPFPETPPQGTDRAAASTLAPDATPVVLGTPAPRGELEARQEKPSRQRALHLTLGAVAVTVILAVGIMGLVLMAKALSVPSPPSPPPPPFPPPLPPSSPSPLPPGMCTNNPPWVCTMEGCLWMLMTEVCTDTCTCEELQAVTWAPFSSYCRNDEMWTAHRVCRKTCYEVGFGYPGDVCR